MAMELEYDRSLHGKEHTAGPFEITADMIQRLNASLGETNPAFTSEAGAQEQGFRTMIAPPTLCSIFVREVALPDVGIKFGRTQMHAGQRVEPKGPNLRWRPVDGFLSPEGRLRQDGSFRHDGLRCMGDHVHQPRRRRGG